MLGLPVLFPPLGGGVVLEMSFCRSTTTTPEAVRICLSSYLVITTPSLVVHRSHPSDLFQQKVDF